MRTVSKQAGRTLRQLIEAARATDRQYLKIDRNDPDSGIMPLTVEHLRTVGGLEFWSLAHWYTQNGDAMRDPEIVYAVPVWNDRPVYEYAYPVEYRQDNLGIMRELVEFENGKPTQYRPAQQADTAKFTTMWMRNLRWQQNLNKQPLTA